jgi:hypothetical protein
MRIRRGTSDRDALMPASYLTIAKSMALSGTVQTT